MVDTLQERGGKKSHDESDIEKYKFRDNKNRTETLKDWVLVMDTWKAADI